MGLDSHPVPDGETLPVCREVPDGTQNQTEDGLVNKEVVPGKTVGVSPVNCYRPL